MRAALYCRVSTAQQTEKCSLDAQRRILTEYCQREGHSTEFFIDAGISGETISARPEFQRLLREAEAGKFDVVLAVDADRYSRASDLTDWQRIKRTFREARVRWGTPSQWLHDNEFITDINAAVSAEEKRKILARTTRGKIEAAKRGKYLHNVAPFGYSKKDGTLEFCKEEAEVVRRIFKQAQAGKTIYAILKSLNSAGVPTPSMRGRGMYRQRIATKWNMTTMRHLLRNKTYMGQGSWNSVPMKAPVIVEPEIFDAVQHMLERNASFAKRYTRHEYLMRGLLFCECGARMYGHMSHGRRFYRCGKNCGLKNVRAEPIERRALTDAYDLLSSPKVVRELYKRQKAADPEKSAIADAMSSVSEELERLPDERRRIMDVYQRGVGDIVDLQRRLARVDAREERLKKDLSSLQTQGEASISQAERREAWMAAAKALKDFRLGRGDQKQARRASMKALLLEWSTNGKPPGLFETQQTIVRAVYEKVVHRSGKNLLYAATVPLPKTKPVWAAVTRRGSSMKLARIRAS